MNTFSTRKHDMSRVKAKAKRDLRDSIMLGNMTITNLYLLTRMLTFMMLKLSWYREKQLFYIMTRVVWVKIYDKVPIPIRTLRLVWKSDEILSRFSWIFFHFSFLIRRGVNISACIDIESWLLENGIKSYHVKVGRFYLSIFHAPFNVDIFWF